LIAPANFCDYGNPLCFCALSVMIKAEARLRHARWRAVVKPQEENIAK